MNKPITFIKTDEGDIGGLVLWRKNNTAQLIIALASEWDIGMVEEKKYKAFQIGPIIIIRGK